MPGASHSDLDYDSEYSCKALFFDQYRIHVLPSTRQALRLYIVTLVIPIAQPYALEHRPPTASIHLPKLPYNHIEASLANPVPTSFPKLHHASLDNRLHLRRLQRHARRLRRPRPQETHLRPSQTRQLEHSSALPGSFLTSRFRFPLPSPPPLPYPSLLPTHPTLPFPHPFPTTHPTNHYPPTR